MIIREPGKSRLFLNEKQKLDITKQIRPLVDEGIQILIEDGYTTLSGDRCIGF